MGKKNEVFPEREPFADLSAAPIQSLCKRKGFSEFLNALVKRVPPFSTISPGWRVYVPIGKSAGLPPWKQTELILNLRYKAGTFKRFAECEGAYNLFSEFFGARYFDKLQRCYECALSLEAGRIAGRLQSRLAEQLSPVDYESQIEDLHQQIFADCIWPPVQFLLDVFNEIAIRFIGNGTPLRFYDHVIRWNTQRIGGEREGREL
jgi:hypothetical protein